MALRRRVGALGAFAVTAACLTVLPGQASAADPGPPGQLVSAVPAATTPDVGDGSGFSVLAFAQVGGTIVEGGTFTSVRSHGSAAYVARTDVFSADAASGVVDSAFRPVVDGAVRALLPGPASLPGTVYLGGTFTHVDGTAAKGLALVSLSDGSLVPGFRAPAMDGVVNTLALAGGRLLVGGTFTRLGGVPHAGLGSVQPTTGALDPYLSVQLAGHHNYGVHCAPGPGCAFGPVGASRLAVSPDGRQLMVLGNFTTADGLARDQIARLTLGAVAAVDPGWSTQRYAAPCYASSYDSYVRDVAYSPDGSYLVVVATGGGGTPVPAATGCDAAARFESTATGSDVQPTWVDYAGNDTLYSVAVSGSAVYVGGHQRWLNNDNGADTPGPGAVPRPGLAALDPVNGLPLPWNPGRNPRGARVDVLYTSPAGASPSGLWVGGDTDYIGNRRYYRGKDSFFPSAGGAPVADTGTPALPAAVYLAGRPAGTPAAPTLTRRTFDGTMTGATTAVAGSGLPWASVRGAFTVGSQLVYATADGTLSTARATSSPSGAMWGPPRVLDPYDDPAWSSVQTGSGQTYRGTPSGLTSELGAVTGLTYASGFVFYTLSGDGHLHYRSFEPDTGIAGATEHAAAGTVDLSQAEGLFVSGGQLYWADAPTGHLLRAAFTPPSTPGGTATAASLTGPAAVAEATQDWRAGALFLGAS